MAGVALRWAAPRGGTKAVAYLVFRDGRRIGRTRHRAFTDSRARPGHHRYVVVAVDGEGRRGRPTKPLRVRVKKVVSPFLPAAPAGPDPSPAPPPPASPLTADMVDRLFWRAGFGAGQAQRDAWVGHDHLELVEWLLDKRPSYASTIPPPLTGGTTANGGNLPIDPLASEDELLMEWLDRMQRADNPLPERIAFFWHRHWAVSRDDGIPAPWLVAYRNRMLAFSGPTANFRQLAYEMTTADAAMSMYLNGNQNVRGRPNENYARELMELFCLGPKADDGRDNYSQADVAGLAKALTGWRLNSTTGTPGYGTVTFSPNHFELSEKKFLGVTLPRLTGATAADGPAAVNAALDAVLGHPSHAPYLIRKLWSEFIVTPIPDATLAELVAVYRSGYALRPVLRGILGHRLIFESLEEPNLIKPPVVYLVGVLRQLGVPLKGNYMTGALTNMQQRPYRPPNVAGWEGGMSWLNTNTVQGRFDTVLRAQFLLYSTNGNSYPKNPPPADVDGGPGESAEALLERAHASAGRPWLAAGTRAALLAYASTAATNTPALRRQRFYAVQALMLGGPDGQVM